MIDHLVYAVPDLEAAAVELTERLGVAPGPGGQHPGWGTRNVLLSLGPRSYLEIVGPSADPPEAGRRRLFGVDELSVPRMLTWCEAPADLDATVQAARAAGYDPGEVRAMERRCADGSRLSWRVTPLETLPHGGLVPFLIDWADAPHPGGRAPTGCSLRGLVVEHPDPDSLRGPWAALGLEHELRRGDRPGLRARLDTPRGELELT